MANNIKYVLIGNVSSGQLITEHLVVKNLQTQKEAKLVLLKCKEKPANFPVGQRTKVKGNQDGDYFFTVYAQNILIFCQAVPEYPDRYVYDLLENINNDRIPLMTDEKGGLNHTGRQFLKQLIDKYQDVKNLSKIAELQNDVNEIQLSMNSNVRKLLENMDNSKHLQEQSNRIKDLSADYKNNAKELERVTWWKNCKLTIIIIAALILLILIIVLPIVLTKK